MIGYAFASMNRSSADRVGWVFLVVVVFILTDVDFGPRRTPGFPDVLHSKLSALPFRKKMSKRKVDCSLDGIIIGYLKKVKCEKTSKMFGTEPSGEIDHSNSLKDFMKFWFLKVLAGDAETAEVLCLA